jgi:hypothetical protein
MQMHQSCSSDTEIEQTRAKGGLGVATKLSDLAVARAASQAI